MQSLLAQTSSLIGTAVFVAGVFLHSTPVMAVGGVLIIGGLAVLFANMFKA